MGGGIYGGYLLMLLCGELSSSISLERREGGQRRPGVGHRSAER